MYIRHTQPEDIDRLLEIYQEARTFMIQQGNPTQWTHGYPSKDLLMQDIRRVNSYVCIEKDRIVGTFAFIIGEDPTYQVIENGAWHAAKEYGTIHRAASDGTIKGLTKYIFDLLLPRSASTICASTRIKTICRCKMPSNAMAFAPAASFT